MPPISSVSALSRSPVCARQAHEASPRLLPPGDGAELRSCTSAASPETGAFQRKSPWTVSPPGLPNPERLQGKQSSPCAPLGLLTRIRSSFLPPPRSRTKAAGVSRVPLHRNAGACGRGWLLPGESGLFAANAGQGKGGKRSTSSSPVGASFPDCFNLGGGGGGSLAKLCKPNKTPATSPGSHVTRGFPPKRRQWHPNRPKIRAAVKERGVGRGIAIRSPRQIDQVPLSGRVGTPSRAGRVPAALRARTWRFEPAN